MEPFLLQIERFDSKPPVKNSTIVAARVTFINLLLHLFFLAFLSCIVLAPLTHCEIKLKGTLYVPKGCLFMYFVAVIMSADSKLRGSVR